MLRVLLAVVGKRNYIFRDRKIDKRRAEGDRKCIVRQRWLVYAEGCWALGTKWPVLPKTALP